MLNLFVWCVSFCVPQDTFPFSWLAGTWSYIRADGSQRLEIWDSPLGDSMKGNGLKVSSPADTILLEHLRLEYKDGTYWYIATVPDQNEARPIPFALTESGNHQWIFENKTHDFPQRITYRYHPAESASPMFSMPGDTLLVRGEDLTGKGFQLRFLKQ